MPQERVRLSAWWMLAVLLALYVLSLIDRGAISLLVVPIQRDLGLSDVQMAIILGPAFAISYSLFGLPMGWASDRFSRRVILFVAITIWSLGAASSGLAMSFTMLLIARILVGAGEAALSPIAYSLIADGVPQRRLTFALSIYQTGSKLGAAASFAVVGAAAALAAYLASAHWPVVGRLEPWQLTLMLTGIPGLFLAFLVFTFREPQRRQFTQSNDDEGFVLYLRSHFALLGLIMLGMMMCSIALLSMGAWVPTLLERSFGMRPQQYGPILSIIHLFAAATLIFKGMLVDWLHSRGIEDAHLRFLSWILIAAAPLSLIAFLVRSPLLFWVPFTIVEIIAGQFVTYIAATAQLIVPVQFRGRIMALFQAAFSIVGMGLGPLIVALVTERIFADPQRLGHSLAIVVPAAFLCGFLAIRAALPAVRLALKTGQPRIRS
jgi:MFS family permease